MTSNERELLQRAAATLEQWQNCDSWTYPDTELALAKKNTAVIVGKIKTALGEPQPCKCIDPQRCDTYDRCCKQEIV
jgi:hypothetical protein